MDPVSYSRRELFTLFDYSIVLQFASSCGLDADHIAAAHIPLPHGFGPAVKVGLVGLSTNVV